MTFFDTLIAWFFSLFTPTAILAFLLSLVGVAGCGETDADTDRSIKVMGAAGREAARSGLKIKGKVIGEGRPGVGADTNFYLNTDTRIEFEFENDPDLAAEFLRRDLESMADKSNEHPAGAVE